MRLSDTRKKILLRLLLADGGALLVALVYAALFLLSKNAGLSVFDCAVKNALGIYCPGCGGSRAVLALLRLDFAQMAVYYPPFVPLFLFALYLNVFYVLAVVKDDERYAKRVRFKLLYIPLATVLLTFFVRLFLLLVFKIDPIGDILPAAV